MKKRKLLYTVGGKKYKLMWLLWKTTCIFLQKIKNRITIWSSNPIYGYISWIKIRISNKYLHICTPMFIGELFTIVKTWKKPKGSSMDLWSKEIWYMHTMKYYLPLTKGILPFAATCMDLENTMLSEISQTHKDK